MSGMAVTAGSPNSTLGPSPGGAVELTDSSRRALKLQTDTPHLVSMGGDRLSTSVTLHPLPQGRVTIGSSPGVDILVQGTGVQPIHCHIENDEGVVTLYPLSENISIDGAKIAGPIRLYQGVMLTIGRSNYMRFNHPAEAKLMKSVLPNPRISMAPIQFEVENNIQSSKFNKKPPVAPRKYSRDSDSSGEEPPSSIMTKVSKFEYLAAQNLKKAISPKVFSSNLVTCNIPAKDVLGKAPPDLQSFSKNLPQSALNYSELNYNEKQKNKTPDRQIFGRKSPQYVNVSIHESKPINHRVIMYENDCVSKAQNNSLSLENQHFNNLNNVNIKNNTTNQLNKTVNLNCNIQVPSPSYNRNPTFRSMTPSPIPNNIHLNQRLSGSAGDLNGKIGVCGSLEDLAARKNEAELRRNQAQVDRIKEQEIEKAEQARLEEILNMCAEYEKSQSEKNNKLTPNRIKTNGSLPRDKRQGLSPSLKNTSPNHSASPSYNDQIFKFESDHISNLRQSHEDIKTHTYYENVEIRGSEASNICASPYEGLPNNIPHFQQSPRTRIKTFVTSKEQTPNRENATDIIESKFAALNAEHNLLKLNLDGTSRGIESPRVASPMRLSPIPTNQIPGNQTTANSLSSSQNPFNQLPTCSTLNPFLPTSTTNQLSSSPTAQSSPISSAPIKLKNPNYHSSLKPTNGQEVKNPTYEQDNKKSTYENVSLSTNYENNFGKIINNDLRHSDTSHKENYENYKVKLDDLMMQKKDKLAQIAELKRGLAEVENQCDESQRAQEMEKALLLGELASKELELTKLKTKKEKSEIEHRNIIDEMENGKKKYETDQKISKQRMEEAYAHMQDVEKQMSEINKDTPEFEEKFKAYMEAQDIWDNEKRNFEDLEFYSLEEQSQLIVNAECLQRKQAELSEHIKKFELQVTNLETQIEMSTEVNAAENKKNEQEKCELLKDIERIRNDILKIDEELSNFSVQESEPEISSDSDSDKQRERELIDNMNNMSFSNAVGMSCSVIDFKPSSNLQSYDLMTQSYNENMLLENAILTGGLENRVPSQDDIDKMSQIALTNPINFTSREGSLAAESLKEIERNRLIHLTREGSQVIEEERRRLQDVKQRAQNEIRNKWALERQQNCSSLTSTGSEETRNSGIGVEDSPSSAEKKIENGPGFESPNNNVHVQQLKTESEPTESPIRPLSETSDISVDVTSTLGRRRGKSIADKHRPLTRYLPLRGSEVDLRQHIETAGHQVVLCPHVLINSNSCRGFLSKRSSRPLTSWTKRWFVFDRNKKALLYYPDKTEKKPRGGTYFQHIEEVFLDHANSIKSPNPHLTFIIKTTQRTYYLMAPSPEAMRIWIDVVFTGAEGYQEFDT